MYCNDGLVRVNSFGMAVYLTSMGHSPIRVEGKPDGFGFTYVFGSEAGRALTAYTNAKLIVLQMQQQEVARAARSTAVRS